MEGRSRGQGQTQVRARCRPEPPVEMPAPLRGPAALPSTPPPLTLSPTSQPVSQIHTLFSLGLISTCLSSQTPRPTPGSVSPCPASRCYGCPPAPLFSCLVAAFTNYSKLGGLTQQERFSPSSGGRRCDVEGWAGPPPSLQELLWRESPSASSSPGSSEPSWASAAEGPSASIVPGAASSACVSSVCPVRVRTLVVG